MKAKQWRDLYPVSLFTLLLMSWGLAGSGTPHHPGYTPIDWGQLLQEPLTEQSCKDARELPWKPPVCELKRKDSLFSQRETGQIKIN